MYAYATFSYHTLFLPSVAHSGSGRFSPNLQHNALACNGFVTAAYTETYCVYQVKNLRSFFDPHSSAYHLRPFWGNCCCCHLVKWFLQALRPSVMLDSYAWSNLSLSHVQDRDVSICCPFTACSLTYTSQKVHGIRLKTHFCNWYQSFLRNVIKLLVILLPCKLPDFCVSFGRKGDHCSFWWYTCV